MGNVSSACEGCFGSKPINPSSSKLVGKHQILKEDTPKTDELKAIKPNPTNKSGEKSNQATTDDSISRLNTSTQSQTGDIILPDPSGKKEKSKLTVDDFDLVKVKL